MTIESARPAQPLAAWAWILLPALAAAAATVAFGVPFRVFGLALPEPVFPMALAFAWPIIRPSLLAPLALLLLGMFLDLYWATPRGLWAMSLLVAYGVLLAARRLVIGQSAAGLAGWYLISAAAAFGAAYLIAALDAGVSPSLTGTGLQLAATVVLFPLGYRLIRRFEDADVRFR